MSGVLHAVVGHRGPAIAAIAAASALLVLPASVSAGSVASEGDRIEISASKGNNRLLIGRVGSQIRIEELNPDHRLTAKGSACEATTVGGDRRLIECPATAIDEVVVSTRGGNDWLVVGRRLPESRGDRNNCRGGRLGAAMEVNLGGGNDTAELGDAEDEVRGGSGRDLLMGCAGDDRIDGGPDGDEVSGDRGNDLLNARGGPDTVVGCSFDPDDVNYPRDEPGDDELAGAGGNDFLYGCDGVDAFAAGGGDDALNTRDGKLETVDCGEGEDVVYLDPGDARPGCEVVTNCTTDNYPIGPDTGEPQCFLAAERWRSRSQGSA